MSLTLYGPAEGKNVVKVKIVAELNGIKLKSPAFQFGVDNKSAKFTSLTPIGKIPVLETPAGPIFESNAIARYVARLKDTGLLGSTAYETALVDQWIDFATNELDTPLSQWGYPIHGYGSRIPEVEEKAIANSKRGLAALNAVLASRTYLVGDSLTLADVVTVTSLLFAIKGLLSAAFLADYPHVARHFWTLVNHPAFAKVIGEVKQIDETPTDVLPAEKSMFGAARKQAAPAPAAAASAAAPAGDEEEAAPKPKAKNPLDLLPPSPMVMDAWKRLYSNTKAKDFREVAIKGFWEMYDPEGYSLWFCDYKFNDENNVKFVTLNKVSGFLQRMDLVRKYAFGKMCILGADPGPYTIKGVWLFRGPEVPKAVTDEVYDSELYDWTKVDLSDEAQKNLVSDYFEEPDVVAGQELQEAKCFK